MQDIFKEALCSPSLFSDLQTEKKKNSNKLKITYKIKQTWIKHITCFLSCMVIRFVFWLVGRLTNYFADFATLKRTIAVKFFQLNKILGNANMLSQKTAFLSSAHSLETTHLMHKTTHNSTILLWKRKFLIKIYNGTYRDKNVLYVKYISLIRPNSSMAGKCHFFTLSDCGIFARCQIAAMQFCTCICFCCLFLTVLSVVK